jgi:hypothetical protein
MIESFQQVADMGDYCKHRLPKPECLFQWAWVGTAVTYIEVHTLPFWDLGGDQRRHHRTAVWTEGDEGPQQADLPNPSGNPTHCAK